MTSSVTQEKIIGEYLKQSKEWKLALEIKNQLAKYLEESIENIILNESEKELFKNYEDYLVLTDNVGFMFIDEIDKKIKNLNSTREELDRKFINYVFLINSNFRDDDFWNIKFSKQIPCVFSYYQDQNYKKLEELYPEVTKNIDELFLKMLDVKNKLNKKINFLITVLNLDDIGINDIETNYPELYKLYKA